MAARGRTGRWVGCLKVSGIGPRLLGRPFGVVTLAAVEDRIRVRSERASVDVV